MLYYAAGSFGRGYDADMYLLVAAVTPQMFRRQSQGFPTGVVGSERPEPFCRTVLHLSPFPYEFSIFVVW